MEEEQNKKPNKDMLQKLVENEPQIIQTTESDLWVTVNLADGTAHQSIYPISTSSDLVADSTVDDLGINVKPKEREKFFQHIEQVKETYVSKVGLKLFGCGIDIERAPKTIIKRYKE